MPDELVDTGSAGAGDTSSVPDLGSDVLGETSTVDTSAAAPVDTSKLSESELFDWAGTQATAAPQQPGPLAKDAGQPAEATPAPQAPQSPGQQAQDAESGFKAALKGLAQTNPAAAKQVRDEHYTLAAYKELYPIQDVRALRGMFGSVDEARQAQTAAARLMEVDHAIVNDPAGLIHDIATNNPQVIEGVAATFGRALFDVSPDLYRQNLAQPAVETYLNFFEDWAARTGNEELKLAIGIMKDAEGKYWAGDGTNKTSQFDRAMQSRLDQLEQMEIQRTGEATVAFQNSVDSTYQTSLAKDVQAAIERSGASLSDKGKQEVTRRVMDQIGQTMQNDAWLQRRLALEIKSGTRDNGHQQRIVEYLLGRAKGLIGPSTRDVIKELTEGILAAQTVKTTGGGAQVRPRGPVGAPTGTGQRVPVDLSKLSPRELKKMSEDDIMAHAAGEL
jgi:hypothetical protein